MPKKQRFGTGITEHEITMYDMTGNTPGDIKAARDAFRAASRAAAQEADPFNHIRETCRAILGEAIEGLPEADSPEAFAGQILQMLDIAADRTEAGDAQNAAIFAFRAGELWATARMKWAWEAHALRGRKVIESASAGAKQTAAERRPERERRLTRMAELVPGQSVAQAARICEREGLGTASAIRVQWYRHQKKL